MRYIIFIALLIILPLHSALSAGLEYQHAFVASHDTGDSHADRVADAGNAGGSLNPDIDLDHDGDFFDTMFFGMPSLPTVIPFRQGAIDLEQSLPVRLAPIFSKRPERPQWPLAV